MTECTNLAAYTEPTPAGGYPGYVSLNREADGTVTLTVRSTGHGGDQVATITLPEAVMVSLAAALTEAGAQLDSTVDDLDALVSRFLTWPVPAEVYPDGAPGQPGRTGTNLLSAPQAKAMLQHVLGG